MDKVSPDQLTERPSFPNQPFVRSPPCTSPGAWPYSVQGKASLSTTRADAPDHYFRSQPLLRRRRSQQLALFLWKRRSGSSPNPAPSHACCQASPSSGARRQCVAMSERLRCAAGR
eukprot:scaffold68538_cov29-Tisochrysis_lutea.AAC.2